MNYVVRNTIGAASRPPRCLLPGLLALVALCLLAPGWAQPASAATPVGGRAVVLTVDGPIGTGIGGYLVEGIERAGETGAGLVIIVMDTPGGLDGAMRDIIQAILAARVPVATFVYPNGARAASAGTYILYASHIAAMAPATNTGSATPVSLGGEQQPTPFPPFGTDDSAESGDGTGDDSAAAPAPATAMERKVLNDSIAYIRGLAELRGRNADWAEAAVRLAENLTARDALEAGVIDIVADDIPDLLAQLDGRQVTLENGDVVLDTGSMLLDAQPPDWRTQLLETITRPEVAYLLLLVGIYGLLFEGYNPGALVPGVVGGICLLIAAYALQVLPVNSAGLGLIALGVALMIAEAFAPSFGVLGLGGLVAFVFGSVILMGSDTPGFRAPVGFITGAAVVGGGCTLLLGWIAMRSRATPTVSGREHMLHTRATAEGDFAPDGTGTVRIQGELWGARAPAGSGIRRGDAVRVTAIDGLRLDVAPTDRETT
jgi:membrane-bound serine protease (ClpP class)